MKKKKPYIFRLLRYYIKCVWYYVLFPLGDEESEFQKQFKK